MTSLRTIVITVAGSLLLSGLVAAQDQEKKIKLPPGIEETVRTQSHGATIRGFCQEKEHGNASYEAELIGNGHSKDVLMDAGGAVIEVEEQISTENLPAAIRDGLQARAGAGKLVKVETLTKKGKLVAYEAHVFTNGKR